MFGWVWFEVSVVSCVGPYAGARCLSAGGRCYMRTGVPLHGRPTRKYRVATQLKTSSVALHVSPPMFLTCAS